jgi:hypothetical protein
MPAPAAPAKTIGSDSTATGNASSATVQSAVDSAGIAKHREQAIERPTGAAPQQPSPPPAVSSKPAAETTAGLKQKEEPPSAALPAPSDLPEKFPATSMQSVKSILSQGARGVPKAEQQAPDIQRNDPFTAEMLKKAMLIFSERIKEESSMLYTALSTHEPEIRENSGILLTLDNPILQKEINKYWNELLEFLKNELRNDIIQLETTVSAQATEARKFLSDKDKLDAMKEKNPEVKTLMDQLNLELDV